jgi:cell wall-associated NlpC family hydrolase
VRDVGAERAAVIAEARSFLGTPFHHQGRLKGIGVDCAYLLAEVYETACGMERMEFGHYPADWFRHSRTPGAHDERYLENVAQRCTRVELPRPGDIALFQMGGRFAHGAVVVAWPMVIHAHWKNGVELADATQQTLARREVIFFSPWNNQ